MQVQLDKKISSTTETQKEPIDEPQCNMRKGSM